MILPDGKPIPCLGEGDTRVKEEKKPKPIKAVRWDVFVEEISGELIYQTIISASLTLNMLGDPTYKTANIYLFFAVLTNNFIKDINKRR